MRHLSWTSRGRLPAAVFALLAVFLAANAARVQSYVWLVDELLWAKAARAFADGSALLVPEANGVAQGPPNGLYPRLLSPLYALLDPTASFHATHVVNALLFASALFPVYLLVRRLGLGTRWAVAAGAMSVVLPWSVATLAVMTEAVAYPAFLWALYAITVAVAQPSPRHDGLALLAVAIACYARTQFVVLAAVLVLGILARELMERDTGRARRVRWRAHLPLAAFLVVAPALYLLLRAAGVDLVGTYGGLFGASPFPAGVWNASALTAAYLVVGVGIVPFVLWIAWLARVAADGATAYERSFALVGSLAAVLVVYQAGFFAQTLVGGNLQERYAFYVVPVFVIGMVLLLADVRRPSPRLSLALGGAAAVALIAGASFEGEEAVGPFEAVAAAGRGLNPVVGERLASITGQRPVVAVAGTAMLLALLAVPVLAARRSRPWIGPAVAGAVGLVLLAQTTWLLDETRDGMNGLYPGKVVKEGEIARDWIDRAVGEDAQVATFGGFMDVPDNGAQWIWTAFFNYSVRAGVAVADRPDVTGLGVQRGRIDAATGAIAIPGDVPPYAVAPDPDPTLGLRGEVVARAPWGASVRRTGSRWRAAYFLEGASFGGEAKGTDPMRLHAYPGDGPAVPTRVTIELLAPTDAPEALPWTVRAGDDVRRGVLRPDQRTRLTVVAPPDGPARSTIEIVPGAAKTQLDGRVVGLRAAVVEDPRPAR